MFYLTPSVIMRAVLWVFGCILLWHFGKELPGRMAELRASRDRMRLRERNPGRDATRLREEYRGDLAAFGVICTFMAVAFFYVFGGLIWFIASVSGCTGR